MTPPHSVNSLIPSLSLATASEFWQWAQAENTLELNQLTLVARQVKIFPNQENLPGTLFLLSVSFKALCRHLRSAAQPTRYGAQRCRGRPHELPCKSPTDKREAAQEDSGHVELQQGSLLGSKTAAQDFSLVELVHGWGIYSLAFITCDNYHSSKFLCRECVCPYSGIQPVVMIHT